MRQLRKQAKEKDSAAKGCLRTSNPRFISMTCIIALLVIAILLILARKDYGNSVVFLYSDSCGACSSIEPEIKEIVSATGLKYMKARYDEPGYAPGVIIIYDDAVLISGYRDSQSLKQQLCGFTKMKKACEMAGEAWE